MAVGWVVVMGKEEEKEEETYILWWFLVVNIFIPLIVLISLFHQQC